MPPAERPNMHESDMPHLLVVDDDPAVRDVVGRYFSAQGFAIVEAADAAAARRAVERERVDLALLDIGLPGEDGLSLTRYLREHWHGPVIIVSGRGGSVEQVVGLELGADDYVTKPFDLRELLARVRSVLRRAGAAAAPLSARYEFCGLRLDPGARRLCDGDGEEIELTSGEFDLLHALIEHPNRVLSRDQLMQRIHGREAGPFDRAIDVQVGRLRRKIEPDPLRPRLIKSVRGAGYLFAAPVRKL